MDIKTKPAIEEEIQKAKTAGRFFSPERYINYYLENQGVFTMKFNIKKPQKAYPLIGTLYHRINGKYVNADVSKSVACVWERKTGIKRYWLPTG